MTTHNIDLPPLPEWADATLQGEDRASLFAWAEAAIEADRKRRGEPVGYIMPTAIKQLKAGGNAIVGGVSQGCDVPIYTAPQPAEPVKVPSDEEVLKIAIDSGLAFRDSTGEVLCAWREDADISEYLVENARALLARYCKGAP